MIIVRDVYQAKMGKGDELVALVKEFAAVTPKGLRHRTLTDASGPFFTVVSETEVASLGEWEKVSRELFAAKEFSGLFTRWVALVDSGRREFFNLV